MGSVSLYLNSNGVTCCNRAHFHDYVKTYLVLSGSQARIITAIEDISVTN
jgi:hypothetical protein